MMNAEPHERGYDLMQHICISLCLYVCMCVYVGSGERGSANGFPGLSQTGKVGVIKVSLEQLWVIYKEGVPVNQCLRKKGLGIMVSGGASNEVRHSKGGEERRAEQECLR